MKGVSEMFEIIQPIVYIIGVVTIILLTIQGAVRYDCNSYEEATGRETKFVGFSCYGKIGDIWYSSDEYNKIIVPSRVSVE